jgi:hypothetical protein
MAIHDHPIKSANIRFAVVCAVYPLNDTPEFTRENSGKQRESKPDSTRNPRKNQ